MSRKYIQFRLGDEIESKASGMVEKTSGSKGLCSCFIAHAINEFANKYELWDLQPAELKEFMKSYAAYVSNNTDKENPRYQLDKSLALLRGVKASPEATTVIPAETETQVPAGENKTAVKEMELSNTPEYKDMTSIRRPSLPEVEETQDSLVDQNSKNKMNQVLARFQSS